MSDDKNKSKEDIEFAAQNQEAKMFPSSTELSSSQTQRRSPWLSSYMALQYISALSRKDFRTSDKVTGVLVIICIVLAAILIFVPLKLLQPPIIFLSDIVFFAIVFYFIINKLGILTTLSERQAVLVWNIMVGSILLGILLAFNIILFIVYLTHLPV